MCIRDSFESGFAQNRLIINACHRAGFEPAVAARSSQIDFIVDRGAYAKTIKLPLKRFTLIGATTRAGMLSAPLRERCV